MATKSDLRAKKIFFVFLSVVFLLSGGTAITKEGKKPAHPFDLYDHEMHMGFFESASVACGTCHADPESFGDREKVNKMGCHICHNSPNPPLPGTNECTVCHIKGPPKPQSHRAGWIAKHQVYAKRNPSECRQCHKNDMFCIDCHGRRDSVQERMHRRNFKFYHSIEARANPRRCDACHRVDFCQECHSGRGTSKR